MKAELDIFGKRDPEADAASDRRAQEDTAAGRVVDHAEVAKWLLTWGTDKAHPMPREWLE